MCSNSLSYDYDEIFDDDANNDLVLNFDTDYLNDTGYMNDMHFNIDCIPDPPLSNTYLDTKTKDLTLFDRYIPSIEDILDNDFEEIKPTSQVKVEPSYTNSLSSECVTDDSSHPSSINSSPVGRKVKKRDYTNNCDEEIIGMLPKQPKIIKDETLSPHMPVYKLSDVKHETKQSTPQQIYINSSNHTNPSNIVTIRQNNPATSQPLVMKKVRNITIKTHKFESDYNSKYQPTFIRNNVDNNNVNKTYLSTTNNMHNSNLGNVQKRSLQPPAPLQQQQSVLDQNFQDPQSPESDYERDNHNFDLYNSNFKSYRYSYYNQGGYQFNKSNSNGSFQHPIPTSGELILTTEEKRTMAAEGFPIPTKLPLSKQEERNLKKVRRKIKNKISAQESRRKKKEYVDALEKKVEIHEKELIEYKKKVDVLENSNRTLQNQVRHLQQQLMKANTNSSSTSGSTININTKSTISNINNRNTGSTNTCKDTTNSHHSTSSSLMLFMFCFVLLLFGGTTNSYSNKMNLPTSRLINSGSFYNMGYGSGKMTTEVNNSLTKAEYSNVPVKFKDSNELSKVHSYVSTRPSILLGEDSDDYNFEELIRKLTDNSETNSKDKPRCDLPKKSSGQDMESFSNTIVERHQQPMRNQTVASIPHTNRDYNDLEIFNRGELNLIVDNEQLITK